MNNPIFIVGLTRSGSTLWLNIVAQNPKIFRIGEMLYLHPWHKDFRYFLKKQVGDLADDNNVEKMVELIFSRQMDPRIKGSFWHRYMEKINDVSLKEFITDKIKSSDRTLESIFKIIVEEVSIYRGFNRFCVKFPVYVNYIPQLLQWYPDCKIIHITRDPRAMAVSKTNDPGGTQGKIKDHPRMKILIQKIMMLYVVVQYIWTSKLHCVYKDNPSYALFSYEDLLNDPENIVRRVCEFAGMEFVPEMLMPKEGQASSVTSEKKEGFNRKAAYHWKRKLSALEEKIILLLTRSSMKRFGYDPDNHPLYKRIQAEP